MKVKAMPVLRAVLFGLALAVGPAMAPAMGQNDPYAAPATVRLAQVVMRLPRIHFYAIAQDEAGAAVDPRNAALTALVGTKNLPVAPAAADGGISMIFLVDISASLNRAQFSVIKASVLAWIDSLQPEDRAAIVTLGEHVRTVQDFTSDKNALRAAMTPLQPKDQKTLLYQGIVQSIDLARRLDRGLPLRRAIVVLTDGLDDQEGGAGRQEVVDKLGVDPVPIYALGASRSKSPQVDAALKDFASLARLSGGDFRRVDLRSVDEGYSQLHRLIDNTAHLTAECDTCVADGTPAQARLFVVMGNERLTSQSVNVRQVGVNGRPNSPPRQPDPPPPAIQPTPTQPPPSVVPPAQAPAPAPNTTLQTVLNFLYKLIIHVPAKWWLVLLLILTGGTGAAVYRVVYVHTGTPSSSGTKKGGDVVWVGLVQISHRVRIEPGTHRDRQRLRLSPVGRNDLPIIEVLFEDELTVGRAQDRDICIFNDTQVSAKHCTLSPAGQRILVRDEASRNGTRVNGVPIPGSLHAEADALVGIGRTELRLTLLPPGA